MKHMKNDVEKFVRETADYTLRECYKSTSDMKIAEELFMEIYAAWYKNKLSNVKCIRMLILKYEIVKFCSNN